jgi:hypothetical protein
VTAAPDDALSQQLRVLRREYLADSAKRVDELRRLYTRLAAGEQGAAPELRQAFHRLAGSGGSYGFPVVSTRSREGEQLASRIVTEGRAAPAELESLHACVDGVAGAFAEAVKTLGAEGDG